MLYGICNLSIVPLRLEGTDTSEMVSQVLLGEHFKVLERQKKWSRIRLAFDNYEGYIDNKQYEEITETNYQKVENTKAHFSGELIDFITDEKNQLTTIPIGTHLPFFENQKFRVNTTTFTYEGAVFSSKLPKHEILQKALVHWTRQEQSEQAVK